MAMSMPSGGGGDDDDLAPVAEINVTPFVDVMLVLLIIFMVTAPLLMVQVPLELPKTAAAAVDRPKEPLVVSLNTDAEIYFGEDKVSEADLVARLSELSKTDPEQTIFVRADRVIEYGRVMDLLATVGSSGFSKVSLMAEAPKG